MVALSAGLDAAFSTTARFFTKMALDWSMLMASLPTSCAKLTPDLIKPMIAKAAPAPPEKGEVAMAAILTASPASVTTIETPILILNLDHSLRFFCRSLQALAAASSAPFSATLTSFLMASFSPFSCFSISFSEAPLFTIWTKSLSKILHFFSMVSLVCSSTSLAAA